MEIDVTEDGTIRFKKVFNSIVLESEDGEQLAVCMRDSGYEVKYNGEWISRKEGKVVFPSGFEQIFKGSSEIRLDKRKKIAEEVLKLCLYDGDSVGASTLYKAILNPIFECEHCIAAGKSKEEYTHSQSSRSKRFSEHGQNICQECEDEALNDKYATDNL